MSAIIISSTCKESCQTPSMHNLDATIADFGAHGWFDRFESGQQLNAHLAVFGDFLPNVFKGGFKVILVLCLVCLVWVAPGSQDLRALVHGKHQKSMHCKPTNHFRPQPRHALDTNRFSPKKMHLNLRKYLTCCFGLAYMLRRSTVVDTVGIVWARPHRSPCRHAPILRKKGQLLLKITKP